MAFSRDGHRFAVGGCRDEYDDGTIVIWDTVAWTQTSTFASVCECIDVIQFSEVGSTLSYVSKQSGGVLDATTGACLRSVIWPRRGRYTHVIRIVMRPHGRRVALVHGYVDCVFFADLSEDPIRVKHLVHAPADISIPGTFTMDGKFLSVVQYHRDIDILHRT
jgi:WD40 repeat protein